MSWKVECRRVACLCRRIRVQPTVGPRHVYLRGHARGGRARRRGAAGDRGPPSSGAGKLHWYNLSGRTRLAVVKAIAGLPALHLVVVRTVSRIEPSERRRRKCLARLVYELANRRVTHVAAEARERKTNLRELDHLNTLRMAGVIDKDLRYVHIRGPEEPILWAADAIAGAVVAARLGQPRYLEVLAGLVDLVHDP